MVLSFGYKFSPFHWMMVSQEGNMTEIPNNSRRCLRFSPNEGSASTDGISHKHIASHVKIKSSLSEAAVSMIQLISASGKLCWRESHVAPQRQCPAPLHTWFRPLQISDQMMLDFLRPKVSFTLPWMRPFHACLKHPTPLSSFHKPTHLTVFAIR